jgi:hypothetical protein
LFDVYGLPDDFPQRDRVAADRTASARADRLESAIRGEIDDYRLIPYLQLHEFEALVLASLDELATLLTSGLQADGLDGLRKAIGEKPPEEVNDGLDTAPSKLLRAHVPGYSKPTHGPMAAELAGIARLRARCPRFSAWVTALEQLAPDSPNDAT